MPAVAWIALCTAIVSVIFNVYNLVKANQDRQWTRSEGSRTHNTEIRSQLIEFLQTLRDELRSLKEDLSAGKQLANEVPPSLSNADEQFKRFEERMVDPLEKAALGTLSAVVGNVRARWSTVAIEGAGLTMLRTALEKNNLPPDSEPAREAKERIAQMERAEPIERSDMRDSVKEAIRVLDEHIGFLNQASAGGKVRAGGIGFVQA
ncbi:hypothetical protein ACIBEH_10205 [Nocardia salmonicida]|uniref:hypothetical protein n=1 Tax=Nocardia salmonicida TaxID=53431 RepID=UPI00378AF784